jgi:hypothetical protein
LGIALYLVYVGHSKNLQNRAKTPGSKFDISSNQMQLIGKGKSNRFYFEADNNLLYFSSIDSIHINHIARRNVDKATMSNNHEMIAFVSYNNVFAFSDSTLLADQISLPEMWTSPKLFVNENSILSWSPQNDKIAFTAFDEYNFSYLIVALRNGTKNYQITDDNLHIIAIVWLSNEQLIFLASKDGRMRMFRVNYDGGERYPIK